MSTIPKLTEATNHLQRLITEDEELANLPLCIATTGSDARDENNDRIIPLSPVELIFITNTTDELVQKIEAIARRIATGNKIFFPTPEIKRLSENPLSYTLYRTIPTRAIDAKFLAGNQDVFNTFRSNTAQALSDCKSKHRKRFEKVFLEDATKCFYDCLKGTKKNEVNIEAGILAYDNDRVKSTKYPFLRPIQYKVAQLMMEAAKKTSIASETLKEMPRPIADRVVWLQAKKIIPLTEEQALKVSAAYKKALTWHLQSQHEFAKGNPTVEVDPKELMEVANTIDSFMQL